MGRKYFLFIIGFAICIQISTAQIEKSLRKCKDKLMEQVSQIRFGQFPKCFDKSKLEQLKNSTETLQDLHKALSKNCRVPNTSDIKDCVNQITKFLKSKAAPIQAEIVGAAHTLFEASRGCINSFVKKVSHLDQWVINGCPDELKTK